MLGDSLPDKLDTMNSLASVAYIEGDYEKAIELHELCWQGQKVVLGDTHPETVILKSNLDFVRANRGRFF